MVLRNILPLALITMLALVVVVEVQGKKCHGKCVPYHRCLDAVPQSDDESTVDITVDFAAADDYDCPEILDICCENISPEPPTDKLDNLLKELWLTESS
uniref:PPAF-2-like Clip domain-containing protein n=1 Tax=Anopheles coluzzii TaxID=1518534 RepID=A0A6E8WBK5_ANOCL